MECTQGFDSLHPLSLFFLVGWTCQDIVACSDFQFRLTDAHWKNGSRNPKAEPSRRDLPQLYLTGRSRFRSDEDSGTENAERAGNRFPTPRATSLNRYRELAQLAVALQLEAAVHQQVVAQSLAV